MAASGEIGAAALLGLRTSNRAARTTLFAPLRDLIIVITGPSTAAHPRDVPGDRAVPVVRSVQSVRSDPCNPIRAIRSLRSARPDRAIRSVRFTEGPLKRDVGRAPGGLWTTGGLVTRATTTD